MWPTRHRSLRPPVSGATLAVLCRARLPPLPDPHGPTLERDEKIISTFRGGYDMSWLLKPRGRFYQTCRVELTTKRLVAKADSRGRSRVGSPAVHWWRANEIRGFVLPRGTTDRIVLVLPSRYQIRLRFFDDKTSQGAIEAIRAFVGSQSDQ